MAEIENNEEILYENVTFSGVVIKAIYSSDSYNVFVLKTFSTFMFSERRS